MEVCKKPNLTAHARGASLNVDLLHVGVERAELLPGVVGEPRAPVGPLALQQAVVRVGQLERADQRPYDLSGHEACLEEFSPV